MLNVDTWVPEEHGTSVFRVEGLSCDTEVGGVVV